MTKRSELAEHGLGELLGRDALLEEIDGLLRTGQNVLLFGPPDIGKTALIRALPLRDVIVVDPFEHVSSHLAARIRRAMGRGVVHLAATRSLDRKYLGAVRRIAFWFTVVQVPPLSDRWMERLVQRECVSLQLPLDEVTPRWSRSVVRLARGRPGVALPMVRAAATMYVTRGSLPSPAAAYIEARAGTLGRSCSAAQTPPSPLLTPSDPASIDQ